MPNSATLINRLPASPRGADGLVRAEPGRFRVRFARNRRLIEEIAVELLQAEAQASATGKAARRYNHLPLRRGMAPRSDTAGHGGARLAGVKGVAATPTDAAQTPRPTGEPITSRQLLASKPRNGFTRHRRKPVPLAAKSQPAQP